MLVDRQDQALKLKAPYRGTQRQASTPPERTRRLLTDLSGWRDGLYAARFDIDEPELVQLSTGLAHEAILLRLQITDLPRQLAVVSDETGMLPDLSAGETILLDLLTTSRLWLGGPIRSVHIGFERHVLEAVAREAGANEEGVYARLKLACGKRLNDPILRELANSILLTLDEDDRCSVYYRRQVILALVSHVLRTYTHVEFPIAPPPGGLAPWQVKRAKARLLRSLEKNPSLQEIAQECELSLSHFSRAFRRSVGLSPHAWLNRQRISRAKELIRDTRLPLAEIAIRCGFADQSHFTRAFVKDVGLSPGVWRRSIEPDRGAKIPDDPAHGQTP